MALSGKVWSGDEIWEIKTSPNHWGKDAQTAYSYAIDIMDNERNFIAQELTREEFDQLIEELSLFQKTLDVEITKN